VSDVLHNRTGEGRDGGVASRDRPVSQKKDDRDLIAEFERSVVWAELSGDETYALPTRLLVRLAELLRRHYRRLGRRPKSRSVKTQRRLAYSVGREKIALLKSQGFDEPGEALERVARELQRSHFPELALGTIKDRLQRRR